LRAIASLAVVVALGSCSAVDNFGKFTVGDGGADLSLAGGCTAGCDCIVGNAALGVPDHCRVTPLNGFICPPIGGGRPTVTLSAGTYTLDTGAVPPAISGSDGRAVLDGVMQNGIALFCVGSLVADQGVHVVVVNDAPVVFVADSVIRISGGSWTLGGGYASDQNGASGFAGGTTGGTNGGSGEGASAGKGGSGAPGSGGGGGGSLLQGAMGGAAMGGTATAGGAASTMPLAGFGGGAGGKGSSFGGGGGGGGGAIQFSASWAVTLSSVAFDASGGGGAGGATAGGSAAGMTAGGGGGGGGGGLIVLDAPDVSVMMGCLSVIGGPGGAGGGTLARGGDAHASTACGFVGTAGIGPANGGNGGSPASAATVNGLPGTANGGGGGGAGGYGRVIIRSHSPPPQSSPPGVVPMNAYQPMTLP